VNLFEFIDDHDSDNDNEKEKEATVRRSIF